MATKKAAAPKTRGGKVTPKLQRKAAHGVHGNRGTVWPESWRRLAEAYGGNVALAEEIGVSYQTVYRWAALGDVVPPAHATLVGFLAAAKGLPNPAA